MTWLLPVKDFGLAGLLVPVVVAWGELPQAAAAVATIVSTAAETIA
ncbi:MAG TPA: hypothetical protein VHN16_01660 [Streptosporangiaceae bacterium]|nr:hypothetical protein [Streptosporangiaceae bacterium]